MCVERVRVRWNLGCLDGGLGRMRSVGRHKRGKMGVWEKETGKEREV